MLTKEELDSYQNIYQRYFGGISRADAQASAIQLVTLMRSVMATIRENG